MSKPRGSHFTFYYPGAPGGGYFFEIQKNHVVAPKTLLKTHFYAKLILCSENEAVRFEKIVFKIRSPDRGGHFFDIRKSCFFAKKVPKTTFFIINSSCVVRMRLLTLKKYSKFAPRGRSGASQKGLYDPPTIFPNFDPYHFR